MASYSFLNVETLQSWGFDSPAAGVQPVPSEVVNSANLYNSRTANIWKEAIAIACSHEDAMRSKLRAVIDEDVVEAFMDAARPHLKPLEDDANYVTLALSAIGPLTSFGDRLRKKAMTAWSRERRNAVFSRQPNAAEALQSCVESGVFTHAFTDEGKFRFDTNIPIQDMFKMADHRRLGDAGLMPTMLHVEDAMFKNLKAKVDKEASTAQCEKLIGNSVVPRTFDIIPNAPRDVANVSEAARAKVVKALAGFKNVHAFCMFIPARMVETFADIYAEARPRRIEAHPTNALSMLIKRAATTQKQLKDSQATKLRHTTPEALVDAHEMIYNINDNPLEDPSFPPVDIFYFLLEKAEMASYNVSVAIYEWRKKLFAATRVAASYTAIDDTHDYIAQPFTKDELKAMNKSLKEQGTARLLTKTFSRRGGGRGGGGSNDDNGAGNGPGARGGRGNGGEGRDKGGARRNNERDGKKGKDIKGKNDNNNNDDSKKSRKTPRTGHPKSEPTTTPEDENDTSS